ncbi:MAG: choice-of-anchor Q domain-containing protein [Planctomycetota bacterium]
MSGEIGGIGSADNSIHVLEVECPPPTSVSLYSLEVTGGYAEATAYLDPNGQGAGLFMSEGTLQMLDCELYGNYSFGEGASFYLMDIAGGSLSDCLVRDNSSTEGSGAYVVPLLVGGFLVEGTTFLGNQSSSGTGGLFAASTKVKDCIFEENTSDNGSSNIPSALFGLDVVVRDCDFVRNHGAGTMRLIGRSYARDKSRVERCLFEGNSGPVRVEKTRLVDCEFIDNGPRGALDLYRRAEAIRCEFRFNHSDGSPKETGYYGNESNPIGGALNVGLGSLVDRCLFEGNTTRGNGGAIVVDLGEHFGKISNSMFVGNSAQRNGGAFFVLGDHVQIHNNTVVNNLSRGRGGGIYFEGRWSQEALVSGCILWGNVSGRNSLFRKQMDEGVPAGGASWRNFDIDLEHSIVQGARGMPSVSSDDPGFVDPINGDYHLAAGSPAINALPAGLGVRLPSTMLDLDGNPRDDGNGIDFGAFERQ